MTAGQQGNPVSWLDRPLVNWNKAGEPVPGAPAGDEPTASVISRCKLTPPRSTMAERAIESAGWIPFWSFDQQLVREDVEIVGGMRGADGMCRPLMYNLFVFVRGQFAGRLSPTSMDTRLDSSTGIVRMSLPCRDHGVRALPQQRSALLSIFAGNRALSHRPHHRACRRAHRSQNHSPLAGAAHLGFCGQRQTFVGLLQPIGDGRFHFVPVPDLYPWATFDCEARSTRRTWGAFSSRPRNTHTSRYFNFGRTKK